MVAADVDNDIFRNGETVSHGDGEGLANLSYRITALYTGRDNVLGASAGLKHFGKHQLARSGSYLPGFRQCLGYRLHPDPGSICEWHRHPR